MKYFYFIFLILLITFLFIFSNLNPDVIVLDLFFLKIEGISVGFSMISSVLIGAIISVILQLPRLLRRNSKVLNVKEDENP
ncbi:hypothetical protein OA262_01965 [Gammaproteobacteria bacterium]|nr:hypothetical protein [Gammaproteobacteria bacterium]